MKRLRTLVVMHKTLVPPDSLEGHSAKEIEEWRTEYDVVSTLKKSGHEVRCLGISDSVEELRSVITEWKPEIVFNLLEEFDGIVTLTRRASFARSNVLARRAFAPLRSAVNTRSSR